MSKVKLEVPSFMNGALPADGSSVNSDITLYGTDGTNVIIKKSSTTIYTESTNSFEGTAANNSMLYQFIFPLKTLTNSESLQFTTPSNSVYVFTNGDGLMKNNDKFTKNVSSGTISIKAPSVKKDSKTDIAKQAAANFIDNTALVESSLTGMFSDLGLTKDSPFEAVSKILFKVFQDMIIVLIYWVLFVSISCWLMVPADLLYPTNVNLYPYVFYNAKTNGVTDLYFEFLKHKDDDLCKLNSDAENITGRSEQKILFDTLIKLEKENPSVYNILKVLFPAYDRRDEKSMNRLSKNLLDKCLKNELCTTDYFLYLLGVIVFQNYNYSNMILSTIHSGFATVSNKVLGNINKKVMTIVFAFFLYYMFLNVGLAKDQVSKLLKMTPPEVTSEEDMKGQFINLIFNIFSACLSVALPMCSLLIMTCLMVTAYVLFSNILFPHNATIMIISFLTFFFSMSQYMVIIMDLAGGKSPLELIETIYSKDFNIMTLGSFMGITVPIICGLSYGMYVGVNLFISFFQFLKLEPVLTMLKNTVPSIVMIGLFMIALNVKKTLGSTYFVITFLIICLIGLYMMTKS